MFVRSLEFCNIQVHVCKNTLSFWDEVIVSGGLSGDKKRMYCSFVFE